LAVKYEQFKKIEDEKYISALFRNLARYGETPLHINYKNVQFNGGLTFNDRRGTIAKINLKDSSVNLCIGDKIKLTFSFKDLFINMDTEIIDLIDNAFHIQKPVEIYVSLRRMVSRYIIQDSEYPYINLSIDEKTYKLSNISTRGLCFVSEEVFHKGQVIRNAVINIALGSPIHTDVCVKNRKGEKNGFYNYGVKFIDADWGVYHGLFKYIFMRSYPNLRSLNEFSLNEIYTLFEESGYMALKHKDEMEENFTNMTQVLNKVDEKPQLTINVVYYGDGKLLSGASLLRVYNGTFLGHQLASIPGARLYLKSKSDIYLGFCDFLLNHPYFRYYLAYFNAHSDWHAEMYKNVFEQINDKRKLILDTIQLFEYAIGCPGKFFLNNEYSTKCLNKPNEFFEFCNERAEPLIADSYGYNSKHFDLKEIKQTYEILGLYVSRRLWGIYKDEKAVAYAVAEAYPDGINLYNLIDMVRIYFIDEAPDIQSIINSLLPEVTQFFKKYKKKKFNLLFKASDNEVHNIKIEGLIYSHLLGRFIANREGASEYMKILQLNFR
jgi:hypothetical protein